MPELRAAFMRRAFELAQKARGRVEPNPIVGAVVVQGDEIVGEGWHDSYGGPHAEVNALAAAGPRAVGADIYVSLEPCSTAGKTPACVDALKKAQLKRVIYASQDPNPKHQGRAEALLRAAGLEVQPRFLSAEGDLLLDDFRQQMNFDRPVVVAKWAASLDGRIATRQGESKWLSALASRQQAHVERARSEGILVGVGTVLRDDPALDVRHVEGRSPRPVLLDGQLRTPPTAKVLQRGNALIWTSKEAAATTAAAALLATGAEIKVCQRDADGRLDLQEILSGLKALGIHRLMVEGGGQVLGSFFAQGLVDLVQVYVAALVLGDQEAKSAIAGPELRELAQATRLELLESQRLDQDLFCSYRVCPKS